ncbi:glycerol-3-phosphate dehydrogenase/oxidase [Ruegeria sp. Alg231-54]|uniref:glycerol-3-phosphate dehydrogenase/oxidase n=1 Tax=Ruegeria sp. Alg231-54 TaxID=1922221 RepID=UPI000D5570E3|nr:glycerol-3-phosphate dehydrogenase/oxidase [Ruegeria sp. Alg231-54]
MSKTRQDRLDAIARDPAFDVVVIGGGVNGIGTFRDLSLQGLRVLLVERNDFSSGCSAAPSRMIHGGLRYLENGEFSLVQESLRERDVLLSNAAHMVHPLPTVVPVTSVFSGMFNAAAGFFGWSGKPARRGALPIKLGLSLYDWITRKRRALPRHKFHSAAATHREWPALTTAARFSAVFYDAAITHPERLCIEMIADTEATASECIAVNYAGLTPLGDGFVLTCQRSGRKLAVQPRTIVNATGAWLDSTAASLGNGAAERMVSGTKGSHVIVENQQLLKALNGHMVYFENADGRVCIAFPFQGNVLAGSTDIRVDKACRVRCEDDEMDYILGSLQSVFPEINVSPDDVLFSFSGIRPLPQSDQDFTGRISRGHFIKRLDGKVPQFCMIGGKWTTFRAFAEDTADLVLAELSHERRCKTEALAIGGGRDFLRGAGVLERDLVQNYAISPDRATHLVSHYGSAAAAMQDVCSNGTPDLPLAVGSPYSTNEIAHLIRTEQVEDLSDIVLRRTALAITGAISMELIEVLAEILAAERGLSPKEIGDQQICLIEELSDYYGVSPQMLTERNNQWRKQCV